jgi:hypothetical protein
MNTYGVGMWVVCISLLPFSCRDFGATQGGNASGQGGTDLGGTSTGGHDAGSGNLLSNGDSGALSNSGQSGADSNVGGRLNNDDLPGASGSSAGNDAHDVAGASSGGFGGEGGHHSVKSLSPAEVEKVVLWLRASPQTCVRDDDQRISVWLDASGNGNDAKPDTSLLPPRYISDETGDHDVVRFTPLESLESAHLPERLLIADDESLHIADGDFSILLVGKFSNSDNPAVVDADNTVLYNGAGTLLAKQEHSEPYPGILWMANYPSPFGRVRAQTRLAVQLELGGAMAMSYSDQMNQGDLRLYGLRRRGTDLGLFVNGEREGGTHVAADTNLSAVNFPVVLGGEPVQPLRGDIAEVVLVKGALSDAEQEGLQTYLMETYGLP